MSLLIATLACVAFQTTSIQDKPFGFYHPPSDAVAPGTTSGIIGLRNMRDAVKILDRARQDHAHIFITMAGGRNRFQDEHGAFSLDMFQSQIERFRGLDLSSYVKDGTVLGHLMFDEPHDPTNWDGRPVPPSVVDQAAKISKELWPYLPTSIGSPPTYITKDGPMKYLDYCSAAYARKQGPFSAWLDRQVTTARAGKVKLVVTINVLDFAGKGMRAENLRSMSSTDLESLATTALDNPYVAAVLMWKWDPDFTAIPGVQRSIERMAHRHH